MPSPDLVSVGETMVLVAPDVPGPIRADVAYRLRSAGAESNVAVHLTRLGHTTAWAGALGDDPFADLVLDHLSGAGVDVSLVDRDPSAPTGLFFKETTADGASARYYRAGSAASKIGAEFADRLSGIRPAILHTTGITAAISRPGQELARRLLDDSSIGAGLRSFDVNYRPTLWPVEQAGPHLAELANLADIVFVGLDEARTLWGARDSADVRDIVSVPRTLVVKDDARAATVFDENGTLSVEPDPVIVVEPIGAGDAFAAGWLSGLLRGSDRAGRLRLAHAVAARVLVTAFDDADLASVAQASGAA